MVKPENFRVLQVFAILIVVGVVVQFLRDKVEFTPTKSVGAYFFWKVDRPKDIDRWQLVVFPADPSDPHIPNPQKVQLIKHIACFPGEIVVRRGLAYSCRDKEGVEYSLGEIKMKANTGKPLTPWLNDGAEAVVQPGYYFVSGDGSPGAYDSRYYGPIKQERICGFYQPLF